MNTSDRLIQEAVEFGGSVKDISGQIIGKKFLKDFPDKFFVCVINFYGQEHLLTVAEFMMKNRIVGFDKGELTAGSVTQQVMQLEAETVPVCPVHGQAMKPSTKPGWYYCSKKVGSGFCKEQAKK